MQMLHMHLLHVRIFVVKEEVQSMEPAAFREARTALGKTQTQLAETLDVSLRTVINWETGKVEIPRMAEFMVTRLVEDEKKAALPTEVPLDPKGVERIQKYGSHTALAATEAADYLGVNIRTLCRWEQAGLIQALSPEEAYAIRKDRKVRAYAKAELDRFIEEDRQRTGRRRLALGRV